MRLEVEVVYILLLVSALGGCSRKKKCCEKSRLRYNASNVCVRQGYLEDRLSGFENGDFKLAGKPLVDKAVKQLWVKSSKFCSAGDSLSVNLYRLSRMVRAISKQMSKSGTDTFTCVAKKAIQRKMVVSSGKLQDLQIFISSIQNFLVGATSKTSPKAIMDLMKQSKRNKKFLRYPRKKQKRSSTMWVNKRNWKQFGCAVFSQIGSVRSRILALCR